MKRLIAISFIILFSIQTWAQGNVRKDFKAACDSLSSLMTERTTVQGNLKLKSVLKRDGRLDFYFDEIVNIIYTDIDSKYKN